MSVVVVVVHVSGVRLCPELRPQTGLLFIAQMICDNGEPWWKNQRTWRKTLSQCTLSTQIPHGPTQVSAVSDWQLTSCAMAWTCMSLTHNQRYFCDGMHWSAVLEVLSQKDTRARTAFLNLFLFWHWYN
jgi:hypothetical protein